MRVFIQATHVALRCSGVSSTGARRGLFGDESNSGDAAAREFQISRPPLRKIRSDDNLRGVVQKRLPAPVLNPFCKLAGVM
jgi:hypothetical protein